MYLKNNKKEIGILTAILLIQSSVYFLAKLFQPYQIVLNNNLDDKIPFIPEFIYFYILWYLLLFLVPLLVLKYSKKNFNNYILTSISFITIEFLLFVAFPTTINRYQFDVNNLSTFLVDLIYKSDTPVYNLFPSGHCAYAFLFVTLVLDTKNIKINTKFFISIISLLIILSTLFIKQHVLIDVIGALIIIPLYYFVKKQNIDLERTKLYAKIFRQRKAK